MKNQLYPCLWFDGQAKEAATFYCSFFPNSKVISENAMVVLYELNGNKFMGLNGGALFKHSAAVSFVIDCKDQAEVDFYWNNLIADGGSEGQCGWCQDKFGVSWQVVPTVLGQLMSDPAKSQRVMDAFMKMKKIDIAELLKP